MTKLYTASDIGTIHAAVSTLESSRASSLATFNAGPDLQQARRMLENLQGMPPSNLTATAEAQGHRRAVERLMGIVAA